MGNESKLESAYKIFKIVAGVIVAFWGFLVWTGGWIALPQKVEANETEIARIKDWEQKTDTKLELLVQGLSGMKDQQTEMRQDIKTLLQRRN
jgi:hypothetical protein